MENSISNLQLSVTKNSAFEARLTNLEALQADNHSQTLPTHVDTTITTQKSSSSIHSSTHDNTPRQRPNKRRKDERPNRTRRQHTREHMNPPPNQKLPGNTIYAPDSNTRATFHTDTDTWAEPPPQAITQPPPPQTHAARFSLLPPGTPTQPP